MRRILPYKKFVCFLLVLAVSACFATTVATAKGLKDQSTVKPVPLGPKWWYERHGKMKKRVAQGNVDMIMIGDSITHSWDDTGNPVWEEYYAPRNAVNLGISTDRTQHVLWRLNDLDLKAISPKLAMLMIGTNNSGDNRPEEIAVGIKAIIEKLRKDLPKTKILILGIFPRGANDANPRRQVCMKTNKLIAKLADGDMVNYLDICDKFMNADRTMNKNIKPDLLHLTSGGYRTWAESVEPAVAKVMGPKKELSTRPHIHKLGTVDSDAVECTPIVFRGKLYRFQWMRKNNADNVLKKNYFRLLDTVTGQSTKPFGIDHVFGSAFVEGDTVYVTGTSTEKGWTGQKVDIFASTDLENWKEWNALDLDGWGICNTSICKAGDEYVMMFEIHKPKSEAGAAFTPRFAKSKDLKKWELTPSECVYGKDRYAAPHCLRYDDGWFYCFYLEAGKPTGYETYVVRSKDLINWTQSPLNPVLRASKEDKVIANPRLSKQQRERVERAKDCNNSDIDFCDFQGKLIISYSWGNQKGEEFLGKAVYGGNTAQFLKAWFPGQ